MSSTIEIKINNDLKESKTTIIYPNIFNKDTKKIPKIFKIKDKLASATSILEKEYDIIEEEKNELNDITTTDKKKKKKKKFKRKKKRNLSINFKYKLKKSEDFQKRENYKIKYLSKSVTKFQYISNKNLENIDSKNNNIIINIPKIEGYSKNNSTKKIINYKEKVIKNHNNSNENINVNNNINILNSKNQTRTFNFKNKINNLIESQKYALKNKKKICMTPKPKIIINQGGNEVDSMNGGHSNNYTSKYILEKALKHNNSIEGEIGEGIDSSVKVNIRGKKSSVSASINKTNPNTNRQNSPEKNNQNNDNNNEGKNEINIIDIKDNGNNDMKTRRKIFSNLLKSKTKYYFNEAYKRREEIEKRFVRIRKSYQQNEFNQSIQNMKTYIYLILPGNASYLVKNCMCHRINWKEPFSSVTSLYNFKWQQVSFGIDYNSLGKILNTKQLVNHFENHHSISNKANMFINLMDYCEKRKISVFKYVPFTIIFQFKDRVNFDENTEFVKTEAQRLDELKHFIKNANKYLINYDGIGKYYNNEDFKKDQIKREKFDKEKNKKLKKKLKRKDGIVSINNDNEDINKIANLKYESDIKVYSDFFPKVNLINRIPTVIRDKDGNIIDEEEKETKSKKKSVGKKTLVEIPKTHNRGKDIWIVKAINLNRGMCIKVANSYEQIEKIIQKFKEGVDYGFTEADIDEPIQKTNPKNEIKNNIKNTNNTNTAGNTDTNGNEEEKNAKPEKERKYYCSRIIIQKYIERPLLYRGRKCDIRIWVLLTQYMKVYVFKEGHLKTCSVEFNIDSNNAFTHITNYSFQKYNDNFQKFEKGNEVPFFDFQKFIDERYSHMNYKLNKNFMEQIKEIISISMRSVKDKINKNDRNYQFEIFGYDFMLDEDFNVFLIEINTNPGLEESSPWIKIIVPRMLDDALRLTLDQLFEPKYDFNLNYKNMDELENLDFIFNNLKNNTNSNDTNDENKNKINKNDKTNKIVNNKKYISPFPVPGYSPDENLWDFVCDLNSKDPNDDFLDEKPIENKDKDKDPTYSGIKHLLKKKNKTKIKIKQ